jgi:hypothetical protein
MELRYMEMLVGKWSFRSTGEQEGTTQLGLTLEDLNQFYPKKRAIFRDIVLCNPLQAN